MKLKRLTLIPLIIGISIILGGYAFSQTVEKDTKTYRTIMNPFSGVKYNIPAEFPNPYDSKEMENFKSMEMPIEGGFTILMFNKVDEKNEVTGCVYGLVFESLSQRMVAAVVVNTNNYTWKYWIYPEDVPIPCTREEQEEFVQEWSSEKNI